MINKYLVILSTLLLVNNNITFSIEDIDDNINTNYDNIDFNIDFFPNNAEQSSSNNIMQNNNIAFSMEDIDDNINTNYDNINSNIDFFQNNAEQSSSNNIIQEEQRKLHKSCSYNIIRQRKETNDLINHNKIKRSSSYHKTKYNIEKTFSQLEDQN